ncbi:4-hydroxythreonine-4-phosphate dehydrogenase PdxA [Blastopirellula marina]|uniref:4-hydroxythreonine-4-phosphate dehydrogenase PdxA n=2 Tax=Blastopirellula marina TaxID=124 RepID=A0A2S8F5P5_9BACT|nr:4-hydroxythreonine-4-phosphate dehydrogenase PdxA [Blastopirellula marina]PTL41400.1 4-hydroxythreonine-4-phosphate dehydrogenase PdxA [Blastopirellula marina]
MGDPGGVGPEVCLQLLADPQQYAPAVPIVFGDAAILQRVARQCGFPEPKQVVPFDPSLDFRAMSEATVVDFGTIDSEAFVPGKVTAAGGEASYQYIMRAIDAALAGKVDGITTGPINKEALHAAEHFYPGHTEIFIERCGRDTGCMMLTSELLTCSFVTTHVGYRDVPELLTIERIGEVIDLTVDAMRKIRKREPKLLVCGLNPHAGEHGLFGDREEERIIVPAVQIARDKGIQIDGPVPPDTAFLAERRPLYDCVVCMYHDQGHIPLKALAFDIAVNTTLGLPIVRTSVDHGTAFDIAWQGKAKVSSMIHAVRLAGDLSGS